MKRRGRHRQAWEEKLSGRGLIEPRAPARGKVKVPRAPSVHEETFALLLRVNGIGGFVREMLFDPGRAWRFDFAFPAARLAVEIEGGAWSGGRHVTPRGFIADCEKYNAAAVAGWRVLRFTPEHLADGSAIHLVGRVLGVPVHTSAAQAPARRRGPVQEVLL